MYTNVRVMVTYAYGYGGPFDRDYPPDTPITTVRDAAIEHFRLAHEATTIYHLTAQDQHVAESATVGQVAGEAQNVVMRLVQS